MINGPFHAGADRHVVQLHGSEQGFHPDRIQLLALNLGVKRQDDPQSGRWEARQGEVRCRHERHLDLHAFDLEALALLFSAVRHFLGQLRFWPIDPQNRIIQARSLQGVHGLLIDGGAALAAPYPVLVDVAARMHHNRTIAGIRIPVREEPIEPAAKPILAPIALGDFVET